jgi:fatty acid desaturase
MGMYITYRRTGGVWALLAFAAVALAAMVVGAAVAATLLVATLAIGAVALVAGAVLPASWRQPAVRPLTPWPLEAKDRGDRPRMSRAQYS